LLASTSVTDSVKAAPLTVIAKREAGIAVQEKFGMQGRQVKVNVWVTVGLSIRVATNVAAFVAPKVQEPQFALRGATKLMQASPPDLAIV
jgi:hypothetical protein